MQKDNWHKMNDIRRQDKSAGTDNHRIVKHRGGQHFCLPWGAGYPRYATDEHDRNFAIATFEKPVLHVQVLTTVSSTEDDHSSFFV